MNETAKQQLPSGPSTLCFNKEDFMKVCAMTTMPRKKCRLNGDGGRVSVDVPRVVFVRLCDLVF